MNNFKSNNVLSVVSSKFTFNNNVHNIYIYIYIYMYIINIYNASYGLI